MTAPFQIGIGWWIAAAAVGITGVVILRSAKAPQKQQQPLQLLPLTTFPTVSIPKLKPHRAIVGLPPDARITYRPAPSGAYVDVLVDGKFVSENEPGRAEYARKLMMSQFAERRKALPQDANPYYLDRYSKTVYGLPTWISGSPLTGYNYRVYDEFGRTKPGHVGFGGAITDSFTRLLDNPLMSVVVQVVIVYATGPGGLIAYGAVRAYAERGADLSVSDVALASARSAAVAYCGPSCGVAFDLGVGVASGDSADAAAEKAMTSQMNPEQRAYYEQGKAAVGAWA